MLWETLIRSTMILSQTEKHTVKKRKLLDLKSHKLLKQQCKAGRVLRPHLSEAPPDWDGEHQGWRNRAQSQRKWEGGESFVQGKAWSYGSIWSLSCRVLEGTVEESVDGGWKGKTIRETDIPGGGSKARSTASRRVAPWGSGRGRHRRDPSAGNSLQFPPSPSGHSCWRLLIFLTRNIGSSVDLFLFLI